MVHATRRTLLCTATLALLATGSAYAHTGHMGHGENGFAAGFGHPFSGLDHLLAMVAVGLWAAQRGGRLMVALPAVFVGVMMLGGAVAVAGLPVPFVESGIAASVLILGLLVAAAAKFPAAPSLALVALFAVFHGHAHGTELPSGMNGAAYTAGFALATALLHVVGIALAVGAQKALDASTQQWALRAGGGLVTVAGALIFAGLL